MRTLISVAGVAALLIGAPAALAHQGNPHYRSVVKQVTPAVPGLSLSVLNYDDRLSLHNTSGKEVVVEDYQGKPYVRALPNGVVQVNTNSQAYYLNVDRYGQSAPPGLKHQNRRQFIDAWTVPISVGGHPSAIKGTLTWVPLPNAPLPVGAIFAFAGLVIVLLIGVFVVRRRREGAAARSQPVTEAW